MLTTTVTRVGLPAQAPPRDTIILIVADGDGGGSWLSRQLCVRGYMTVAVRSAAEALALVRAGAPHLLIFDLEQSRRGDNVVPCVRASSATIPVIVLADPERVDVVTMLEGGADDFLAKPYDIEELCARIRARLRPPATREVEELGAGDLCLDLQSRRCTIRNRVVDLTTREFELTETFLRHPNQVLTRDQLLAHLWGPGLASSSNVIDVYVGYLRRKLGTDIIHTVRGIGYRLAA